MKTQELKVNQICEFTYFECENKEVLTRLIIEGLKTYGWVNDNTLVTKDKLNKEDIKTLIDKNFDINFVKLKFHDQIE